KLCLFFGVPADTCGIENNLRATERRQTRTFRIPLVPADLNANARVLRVEIRKTKVTRREIKLFVVKRIIGDVHFAVFAKIASVSVDDRAAIVVNACGATFEQGSDDRDFLFFSNLRKTLRRRAGNRFGKIKKSSVFGAAEILAAKKLVNAHDLRAAR